MSQELLNHKTKCRLCFQRVSVIRNCSRISEKIQQKFLSLTNIELKLSDSFSNYICKPCIKSLNESSEFQQKMIDNQQRLYAFESADKFVIKIEPIDLEENELLEVKIEEFLPKTEVFDAFLLSDSRTLPTNRLGNKQFLARSINEHHCDLCCFVATRKNSLVRHMNNIHLNKKTRKREAVEARGDFKCNDCEKTFAKSHQLKAHHQFMHEVGEYKCTKCGLVFELYKSLSNHRKAHNELIPCEVCGMQVQRGSKMTLHLNTHRPPQYKCSFEGCAQAFLTKLGLKYHILNNHEPKQTIKCPKCDATFSNAGKLKKHDVRTHGERKFICPVEKCHYKSTRRDYFRVHIRTHRDFDVKLRDQIIESSDRRKKTK